MTSPAPAPRLTAVQAEPGTQPAGPTGHRRTEPRRAERRTEQRRREQPEAGPLWEDDPDDERPGDDELEPL